MKIFWSWQSDTPGKTGRHFVRDALKEAVKKLAEPEDIEEPSEREIKEELHVDMDRQGVAGSQELARVIFGKIEKSTVFVADVTLTGCQFLEKNANPDKRFINSNVAIEYGHAHGSIGDDRILMVQNTYYGDRTFLPFDLRHKIGPIEFCLSPNATSEEIKTERDRLRGKLVQELRLYLKMAEPKAPRFNERQSTANRAVFFEEGEPLASLETRFGNELGRFTYPTARAFYLRLIPTRHLDQEIKQAHLKQLVESYKFDVLTRLAVGRPLPSRNKYGAIAYEHISHGSSQLRALTQVFSNGEIWAISDEFFLDRADDRVIPAKNVENIYRRVIENFCEAAQSMGTALPYTIECGAVGLSGYKISVGIYDRYGPIHGNELSLRLVINEPSSLGDIIDSFLDHLFDLAGVERAKIQPESAPRFGDSAR